MIGAKIAVFLKLPVPILNFWAATTSGREWTETYGSTTEQNFPWLLDG